MAFTPGIQIINVLNADQPISSSVAPATIQNSATDQFLWNLLAGKKIRYRVRGVFSTGATGGFRFLVHCSSAPTVYNAEYSIVDVTTPTAYDAAQSAEAAFTNASAVATNYRLFIQGEITANAATSVAIQFAQNNSTVNAITMLKGMTMEIWEM